MSRPVRHSGDRLNSQHHRRKDVGHHLGGRMRSTRELARRWRRVVPMPGPGQVELVIIPSSPSELATSNAEDDDYPLLEKGSLVCDLHAWCHSQTGSGTNEPGTQG